ncbi:MAG: NAD(P)(+) transhydrogenase (Re/Si-specific) subunit beta [Myxococcota bacterium]
MVTAWIPIGYLVAATLFILGLRNLSKVKTAARGNTLAALGMLLAIVLTLIDVAAVDYRYILAGLVVGTGIGAVVATRVPMTAMPEMVALFNGFGGGASALVALSVFFQGLEGGSSGGSGGVLARLGGPEVAVSGQLSLLIGALTFSGSLIAYLKLRGSAIEKALRLPGGNILTGLTLVVSLVVGGAIFGPVDVPAATLLILALALISLFLGVAMVMPIGGADMPVVIALLNSLSGVAAAMTGFVLSNYLLIIAGSLVGASGLILTQIMCKAMNRSLVNVLFSGFGGEAGTGGKQGYTNIKEASAEEVALLLEDAGAVVIVPGYGLAVARAQHVTRELADYLESRGTKVRFAIHPVAGRMPGHMNVLLAEADVPYDHLLEMQQINPEFKSYDVAIVLGANDVVNPAALNDKASPIYGMPILNVHEAQTVVVVKRSLSPGFAGIPNELFDHDNTVMAFGDAKQVMTDVLNDLKE